MQPPQLEAAAAAVSTAEDVVRRGAAQLTASGPDTAQALAYDVAHAASALQIARAALDYGRGGDDEARLACAFAGEAVADLAARLVGRAAAWGVAPESLDPAQGFLTAARDPEFLAGLAEVDGSRRLDTDFDLVRETFRRFAEDRVAPVAERVHRDNDDIPEEVISGLAAIGGFSLSVPEEYGGSATGDESDYLGMVVATEELSRASLNVGGSLITRPEILTRALVAGGTEEQKHSWLPRIASGELMAAVAVTEPDHGSDVAGLTTTGTPVDGGFLVNGVKTWCTFAGRADVLMLLARTDPDRARAHRGLSVLLVPKRRAAGEAFVEVQDGGGRLSGRAIDTIGYRGMHSFELSFDNWFVPGENVVGGQEGLGRGFYLQMAGFENGRLQTAARAVGLMQACQEAARRFTADRHVFGRPLADYQLTRVKLGRMTATIQACRQASYQVARLMAAGEGGLEAAMVKAFACRAAEWVSREAMQVHGGMGYAEEFAVSRYFVDARVLSIFEGADETLALKVIARRLTA